jgi:hypothetical protein
VSRPNDFEPDMGFMFCLAALALCDRFGQATDMNRTTSEYYTKFTSTISAVAVKKWTKEIETAESKRLKNPQAMDIMRAHQPEWNSHPGHSGADPNPTSDLGNQWLQLALSIEERQYVLVMA